MKSYNGKKSGYFKAKALDKSMTDNFLNPQKIT